MNDNRLCYICSPRYQANCTISKYIPICSVCAWNYKVKTDQEKEEDNKRDVEEAKARQYKLEEVWDITPTSYPLDLGDIPF